MSHQIFNLWFLIFCFNVWSSSLQLDNQANEFSVMMIVMKQSSIADQCGSIDYPLNGTKFNHDIETECEIRPVNLSLTSLKSMGICVFAYLSHCNVLAIFAEVRGPSRSGVLKRMEKGIFFK